MKTTFLKSVLPIGAVMLAIAGAFAANSKPVDSRPPPVIGWASLPGQPACGTQVACNTEVGILCTIFHNGVGYQAFPKNVAGQCVNIQLFMRQ